MEYSRENFQIKHYSAGSIILREGDKSDNIYLIRSGIAQVISQYEQQNESIITLLGPGEAFGELGIILHRNRLATVIAKTDIELEIIDPELFSTLFESEIGKKLQPVIQSMAERIRISGIKLNELGYNIIFDSNKDILEDNRIKLVPDSELAFKCLQGKEFITINKFPFRVGRFSVKKSDILFHKNDLYLYEDEPYIISLSQFAITKSNNEIYFLDRSGGMGSVVNGIKVGGFDSNSQKIILKNGENTLYIGKERYNICFKIII